VAAISVGSVEVDVVPNTRGIRQQLQSRLVPAADEVGDEIGRIIGRHVSTQVAQAIRNGVTTGGRTAQPAATRQGQATGSAFARAVKARVEAALRDLPDIELNADSSDAEREIHQIRAQLTALRDLEIGVDIDAAEASTRISQLQARLERLSASDVDIQVRTDTASAAAQLAAFQAQLNRLDGQTANVDVDTRSATASLGMLTQAALLFGPAIIPALPVVAAGLGAIAAAATAAGVGIGSIALVAAPAFMQIGKALQAQKAAQDAATNATYRGGQAASQGASRALQLQGAQQSLATAHRNAARQISQAEQGVSDAVRSASEANRRAKQQLADAVQQAADRQRQSAEQVQRAEESLADAQRDAKRAQQDLNQARRDAAQELAELTDRLANAQLSERDAVLSVQEAQARLQAVQRQGSTASLLEQERAQLAYDQTVQRLKESQDETKNLTAEKKAADKAGVEGSETVRDAQERLRQADEAVVDQQRELAQARSDAARQQVEAQKAVAEAQRSVARTQEDGARSVARAQEQLSAAQQSAADSIASAQRQIESASMSAAGSVDQAAIAQAKYQAELAKMTPAARETFDAFLDLRTAFSAWSRALQPAVMPIFTRALNGLKNSLPGLTPFVKEAATAIQGLQDRASAGFKSPWWKTFKADLETSIGPAITGLGVAFGNIFKGMTGVIGAFLPHMDSISSRMQTITARFARWGQGLKGSPEFERFLSYSSEHAPLIASTLGKIVTAIMDLGQALAPVSGPLLQVIGAVASAVSWVATTFPGVIVLLWGFFAASRAIALGLLLWQGAQWLVNAAMTAFNLISMAGPWGWIVLAIVGVVTALYLLWTKCEWFRDAVMGVWDAIKGAAQTVIDWFAGPFADFFTETIPGFFRSVLNWVRDNWPWILIGMTGPIGLAVVKIIEHWDDIKSGISDAWSWIKKNVLYPLRDFFIKTVPGWGTTLKNKMIEAFDFARKGIKTAWDRIKAIAKAPVQYVVDVVYNDGLRAVWNRVAGAFGADPLPYFKFAKGGVMPGYTPGRDVHNFVSPTGGRLALSGGEAIMRPEFTRAVGSGFVNTMNAIASSRGAQGVKSALAPVFGGNPSTPTDHSLKYAGGGITQSFADGGIFGWIGGAANKIAGAGSAAWNKIKEGASWLGDTLEASARAGVKHVVDPLLKKFPGMDTGFGQMIRRIPNKIIDTLFGYAKKADDKGAGGIGGPKIQSALKWAKTQNGLPYQWGGNGNPSWDCSGFMSAIESVIRGQQPHRRWSTHAFSGRTAPPGWVYHGNSPFKVGITAAGVGHTAGTLGKTQVESRGGDGVVVGRRARGYNDRLFTSWYGFMPGKYDNGGMLQPGFNLAYNGTGRPEPVLTGRQFNDLAARGTDDPITVEIHTQDRALADFIDVRVHRNNQELISVINAG
jgi:phage-related protein